MTQALGAITIAKTGTQNWQCDISRVTAKRYGQGWDKTDQVSKASYLHSDAPCEDIGDDKLGAQPNLRVQICVDIERGRKDEARLPPSVPMPEEVQRVH